MSLDPRADFGDSALVETSVPISRSCLDGVLRPAVGDLGAQATGDERRDVLGETRSDAER
jgi:hypothetical protein